MWKNADRCFLPLNYHMQKFRLVTQLLCILLIGSTHNCIQTQITPSKPMVSTFVNCDYQYSCRVMETPANFPGGAIAWKKYLTNNTKYFEAGQRGRVENCVRIQFIISKYGNVSEVRAIDDSDSLLSAEAVRVIKASPSWQPAYRNGRAISYRFVQTFTFRREFDNNIKPAACDDPKNSIGPIL
jgi:hypothetical protein